MWRAENLAELGPGMWQVLSVITLLGQGLIRICGLSDPGLQFGTDFSPEWPLCSLYFYSVKGFPEANPRSLSPKSFFDENLKLIWHPIYLENLLDFNLHLEIHNKHKRPS